jgi:hypothetical protein
MKWVDLGQITLNLITFKRKNALSIAQISSIQGVTEYVWNYYQLELEQI